MARDVFRTLSFLGISPLVILRSIFSFVILRSTSLFVILRSTSLFVILRSAFPFVILRSGSDEGSFPRSRRTQKEDPSLRSG